jgi:hypothetical protein
MRALDPVRYDCLTWHEAGCNAPELLIPLHAIAQSDEDRSLEISQYLTGFHDGKDERKSPIPPREKAGSVEIPRLIPSRDCSGSRWHEEGFNSPKTLIPLSEEA